MSSLLSTYPSLLTLLFTNLHYPRVWVLPWLVRLRVLHGLWLVSFVHPSLGAPTVMSQNNGVIDLLHCDYLHSALPYSLPLRFIDLWLDMNSCALSLSLWNTQTFTFNHLQVITCIATWSTPMIWETWERSFCRVDWQKLFHFTHKFSISCYTQEKMLNFFPDGTWTHAPCTKNFPSVPPTCWQCGSAEGTYHHLWWDFNKIQPIWSQVFSIHGGLYNQSLSSTPEMVLLSMLPGSIAQKLNLRLDNWSLCSFQMYLDPYSYAAYTWS